MRRVLLLGCLVFAVCATPVAAASRLERVYGARYAKVAERFGARAPGRNIVRWGATPHRRATAREVAVSSRRLRRWLEAPMRLRAPLTASQAHPYVQVPRASFSRSSGGGGLESIRRCESGGNYATNTGNGFSGAYQYDRATWRAAGGSTAEAWQASPAEQDRVTSRWIASGHRSAWPHC